MNTQTQEALKMAIAEIEGWIDHAYGHTPEECADNKAIQACKEALEHEQSFAEKTAQMSFMGLWDAYTTLKMKLEALEQPAQDDTEFWEKLQSEVDENGY